MDDLFLILTSEGRGEYREKGSKFLAYAFAITTPQDVDTYISELKPLHPKARHFCYAYRINDNDWRANDDGEPRHSSGTPILRQIQSAELYQTAIVVLRYFGGTKLGVSGLINAYETAAAEALNKASKANTYPSVSQTYTINYTVYNRLMQLLPQHDGEIMQQEMGEDVTLNIRIRETQAETFAQVMERLIMGNT